MSHLDALVHVQVRWSDGSTERENTAEQEYLHETQMVWNKDDHNGCPLPAGTHSFPFRFLLPPNIPSSFEGTVGWVRYDLYGRIATSVLKHDHVVEIDIPVMEIVDINREPALLMATKILSHKRIWNLCCRVSHITMTVDMTRTGFCVGEDIPLNVSLENGSSHEVTITATLKQTITYTAKRGKKQYDKATVIKVSSNPIAPQTSTVWPTNLKVPLDEATTQNYGLVNIAYSIKVVGSVPWAGCLVARIPVVIGNIPYGESLTNWEGMQPSQSQDDLQFCPHPSTVSLISGTNPHFTFEAHPTTSFSSSSSSEIEEVPVQPHPLPNKNNI